MNRFKNIDWDRLYKVLVIAAAGVIRRYGGHPTFDGGLDIEDLAGEVLNDFFDSPDGLGWKESKGTLETYLRRILHNKAVTHLRRQKFIAGSLDDENSAVVSDQNKRACAGMPERARPDIKAEIYALIQGDSVLEDLVAATELISGGHNANQELGEVLNKTPRQVSKLKERLLEKDGVKELYAARKNAKRRI